MLDLPALCRELVRRGWWVTAAEKTPHSVIVGFNFMPERVPAWLKAFEVPLESATPDGVEHAVEDWKASVRHAILNGKASPVVRQMVAEHGITRVREAMHARVSV
jgi:phosphoglycolate phosphatase-like HAD superfamily hydrolase